MPSIALPGQPEEIVLSINTVEKEVLSEPDDDTGDLEPEPLPRHFRARVDIVVQDGNGLIHRLTVGDIEPENGTQDVSVALTKTVAGVVVAPAYPLSVVSLELRAPLPEPPARSVDFRLSALTVIEDGETGNVDFGQDPWTANTTLNGRPIIAPTVAVVTESGASDRRFLIETGSAARQSLLIIDLRPGQPELPDSLPIVVADDWLRADGAPVGSTLGIPALALDQNEAVIVGATSIFPTVDPSDAHVVIADLPTAQMIDYRPGRPIMTISEQWLSLADQSDESTQSALRQRRSGGSPLRLPSS